MRRFRAAAVAVLAILFALTPPAWAQPSSCSVADQNLFVRDALDELYLWYRDMPAAEPDAV